MRPLPDKKLPDRSSPQDTAFRVCPWDRVSTGQYASPKWKRNGKRCLVDRHIVHPSLNRTMSGPVNLSKTFGRAGVRMAWAMTCITAFCLKIIGQETPPRPVDGIMDNSFLIEEAYNQEKGVVQHIFTGLYSFARFSGAGDRRLDLSFTQEWPAWGQAHQFSYTVPYGFTFGDGGRSDGIGDVLLNYRYQAYFDQTSLTAFAPRFSLILPTGDEDEGFGSGTVGYQWNLPLSTTVGDRWFLHGNAGLTFLPNTGPQSRHDLLNFNLGVS